MTISDSNTVPQVIKHAPAYDVFNGDADGICALHQLRLAEPLETELITGVKRDIALLARVPAVAETRVTALDISLDVNVDGLKRLLDAGCHVTYFDHHAAQQAFPHPSLRLFWDEAPDVCTSILVDRHLQGRYRAWAAAAAFGDNLESSGRVLANQLGLSEADTLALQRLGTVLNYNAYGESVADLHFAPEALYRALHEYVNPLEFIADSSVYRTLSEGYEADLHHMENLTPQWQAACGGIYLLPDERWARRISGIFANQLASEGGGRSFAVLTAQSNGSYSVSVRAGDPNQKPAHRFCETFATGGGRKAAGGVNRLPTEDIEKFAAGFMQYFGTGDANTASPEK